jgi:hypothetical protein
VFVEKAGGVRKAAGVVSLAESTGSPLRMSALAWPPKRGLLAERVMPRVSPGALWKMNEEKTKVFVRSQARR